MDARKEDLAQTVAHLGEGMGRCRSLEQGLPLAGKSLLCEHLDHSVKMDKCLATGNPCLVDNPTKRPWCLRREWLGTFKGVVQLSGWPEPVYGIEPQGHQKALPNF